MVLLVDLDVFSFDFGVSDDVVAIVRADGYAEAGKRFFSGAAYIWRACPNYCAAIS